MKTLSIREFRRKGVKAKELPLLLTKRKEVFAYVISPKDFKLLSNIKKYAKSVGADGVEPFVD